MLVFAAPAEMLSRRQGPGGLPEIGGKRMDGERTNGMSKSTSILPAIRKFLAAHKTGFTGFITTGCAAAGLCAADTIDVYGTSCALGIQFSRGSFPPRGVGNGVRGTWNAGYGSARSRWSLWRAAFLSGRKKDSHSRSHRRRSYIHERLALSTAGGIAAGISESLPADHQNEIAA